jgi:small subunit ribosomal protein S19
MVESFNYRGHAFEKIREMDIAEFAKLLPSRLRRSLKRGFTPPQKRLLARVKEARAQLIAGKEPKLVKTHCRDMVILPSMVGLKFGVHNGREFSIVEITPEKLGHVLGEFTYNRKRVAHSSPGVGATRGSTFIPIK